MAPPNDYKQKNPTVLPFDKVYKSGTNIVQDYRLRPGSGYEILTDDVINSGNLELLYKFRDEHQEALNDKKYQNAKNYLDARIQTAEKLQAYENKAKLSAAQGKVPPMPEVSAGDGYIGFPDLKYPDYQTSANGCWSIAYSTLLKTRGVDLSQEEIRQWRPDYKENTAPNQKADVDRKYVMNADEANSISRNADLLGKVLPNTAVSTLTIYPYSTFGITINDEPIGGDPDRFANDPAYRKQVEDRQRIFQEEYLAQVKAQIKDQIVKSIMDHKSPVALSVDGHYVTVTAINPENDTYIYEESRGAEIGAERTKIGSFDELIKSGMLDHQRGGQIVPGNGIELTWLKDLSVSKYGIDQSTLDTDSFVTADRNGNVTIQLPQGLDTVSAAGNPSHGQVSSKVLEQAVGMDQTKLLQSLNGAQIKGIGPNGSILLATLGDSYPDRVMRQGDPQLAKEALGSLTNAFPALLAGLDHFSNNGATADEKLMVKEFTDALNSLRDAAAGKAADIDKAVNTLAGMYEFLLIRPQGSTQNRFQRSFQAMDGAARKNFVEQLRTLNDSLDLGRTNDVNRAEYIHEEWELAEAPKAQAEEKEDDGYNLFGNDPEEEAQGTQTKEEETERVAPPLGEETTPGGDEEIEQVNPPMDAQTTPTGNEEIGQVNPPMDAQTTTTGNEEIGQVNPLMDAQTTPTGNEEIGQVNPPMDAQTTPTGNEEIEQVNPPLDAQTAPSGNEKTEEAEAPQPKEEARESLDRTGVRNRFDQRIAELWNKVQHSAAQGDAKDLPEEARASLAKIVANFVAYSENVRAHKDPPFPSEEEAGKFEEGVLNSDAFRRALKGEKPWLSGKDARPTDFIRDFGSVEEETQKYAIPEGEAWDLRKMRIKFAARGLQSTGEGSYTGMDLIQRTKNSESYDKAREAIYKAAGLDSKPPSAAELRNSVETVRAYLDGKEKRRGREFGRVRWTNCMRFLADTMPRQDFEDYCNKVNQARNVKPGHEDYVGPESFYPKPVTADYVIKDSISRISCGQNTARDFARIIAAHKLGQGQNGMQITSDKQLKKLCLETQKVLQNANFKQFMEKANKQELARLLENNGADFVDRWTQYQQQNEIEATSAAAQNPARPANRDPQISARR